MDYSLVWFKKSFSFREIKLLHLQKYCDSAGTKDMLRYKQIIRIQ